MNLEQALAKISSEEWTNDDPHFSVNTEEGDWEVVDLTTSTRITFKAGDVEFEAECFDNDDLLRTARALEAAFDTFYAKMREDDAD